MKMLNIFYVMLIISCNTVNTENIPEGMYICNHKHQFAKTEDTLLLKKINSNYYQIERHLGIQLKNKGDKKFRIEKWKLEYDNNKRSLTELKSRKMLIWDSDKDILLLGSREYKKLLVLSFKR